MMNRREFLKAIGFASAAPMWVRFSSIAAEAATTTTATQLPNHMLLVIHMAGGNDGLNTVVPFQDSTYKQLRPTIGLKGDEVFHLGTRGAGLGLHKSMPNLFKYWGTGRLAIVQNVGYPNPNFSHFDSTEIYETASPDHRFHTGWLGRYLDVTETAASGPVRAVAVGTYALPKTVTGQSGTGVVLNSLYDFSFVESTYGDAALRRASYEAFGAGRQADGSMRSKVLEAQDRTVQAVDAVKLAADTQAFAAPTPAQTVAQMFAAGVGTEIAFLGLGSFDTHTTQRPVHADSLTIVDDAIGEFFDAATQLGIGDRVSVLTFSDFGRRAGENGGGTDHGSSYPMFLAGPRVVGGLYGSRPDLTALADGNLVPGLPMENVYATVLEQAFRVNSAAILGATYSTLPIFA